jgi:RNA polymerase sigma factor (sigma-70 family)
MATASPQAVFLEHESWLRVVVRSRLEEPDAVEDVMQNIALAIVRQRSMLGEISRIGAWLYQIAVRQVLLYRRTSGRRRKLQDRLVSEASAQSAHDCPLRNLLAAEAQASVQQALEKLSEIDRQVLMLKYTEGWSYRELADHLGVREDTIEYRLLKARKNLRRLLRQFDEESVQPC